MKRMILFVVIAAVFGATSASAQTDFSRIRLAVGDQASITQPSGISVSGTVTDLTADSIHIGDYTFKPEAGMKVDRTGDSLLTGGTLIGVGVGLLAAGSYGECSRESGCVISAVIVYGGLGLAFDYAVKGHTTVFRGKRGAGATIRPVVGRERKGIQLSLGF